MSSCPPRSSSPPSRPFSKAALGALALAFVACGGSPDEGERGTVVVGVRSKLRPGVDVDRVDYSLTIGAQAPLLGTLPEAGPLAFPLELPVADELPGARVSIRLEARSGVRARAVAVREAETTIAGGKSLLLPLALDPACDEPEPQTPTCPAGQTCDRGQCVGLFVPPSSLSEYSTDWAKPSSDICKRDEDAPTVIVGEGQADYLPLTDGETAQVEAGPQGGHHIWVAIRLKGLRQAGSITTVTGFVPSLDKAIEPFRVVFSFDPDEGGYCKLYGLRFQIDATTPIADLLGREMRVAVEVVDPEGAAATGERLVKLSDATI